jgi:hypothetical protein
MSCKKQFTDDFFADSFSSSFRNGRYKRHIEDVLLDQELARMPETQPIVEQEYKRARIQGQIQEINQMIKDLRQQKIELENQLAIGSLSKIDDSSKKSYVCACPVSECRGFLDSKYECGICSVKACSECREILKDDHVCNKDTVETIKEMMKTCKNCPNCMTSIFKIEGCDQMFCTKCNTAFSWRSGKIEVGIIHNPHYFEWLRKNGGEVPRNPHAEQCGGMPNPRFLHDRAFTDPKCDILHNTERFGYSFRGRVGVSDYLTEIYRMINHFRANTIHYLPTAMDNVNNQDLRVEYLMNKITKEQLKTKLQRREKDRAKKLELRQILEMYCNVVQDMFTELFATKDYRKFIDGELQIKEHCNDALTKLNKRYNSNMSVIIS